MRIVSLVPGATEALFAIGAGDRVVGVSHECDHPPEARGLPRLTASALDDAAGPGAAPAAIDRAVSDRFAAGGGLYVLDRERLAALRPDLVVAQALCPVCAVTADEVTASSNPWAVPGEFEVFSWEASTLGGVLAEIRRVGAAAGAAAGGERLAAGLERRLERVAAAVRRRLGRRPQVVALEWLDPPWLGGHWVPEMIALAGGEDPLGEPGTPSRRATWEEIAAADPDILIAMPCGFGEAAAREQVAALAGRPEWESLAAVGAGRAHAVDGGGLFSRPGPRLADGVEWLAEILAFTPGPSAPPRG